MAWHGMGDTRTRDISTHFPCFYCLRVFVKSPPHGTRLCYATLYYAVLHDAIPHSTTLHCTTPHCTALYHTVLYDAILRFITLHCTTPHYTTLHYTVPYCAVLYYTRGNFKLSWFMGGSSGAPPRSSC